MHSTTRATFARLGLWSLWLFDVNSENIISGNPLRDTGWVSISEGLKSLDDDEVVSSFSHHEALHILLPREAGLSHRGTIAVAVSATIGPIILLCVVLSYCFRSRWRGRSQRHFPEFQSVGYYGAAYYPSAHPRELWVPSAIERDLEERGREGYRGWVTERGVSAPEQTPRAFGLSGETAPSIASGMNFRNKSIVRSRRQL